MDSGAVAAVASAATGVVTFFFGGIAQALRGRRVQHELNNSASITAFPAISDRLFEAFDRIEKLTEELAQLRSELGEAKVQIELLRGENAALRLARAARAASS